ncbi:hypothetical protein [Paraliobacillus sediminis]|uniref:hypothetical protein n=1 Tax=Paraliobacillus sediminis TaxID=1885916 RepID=UPI000E3D4419|nr:hypothetical protein [Paraliobacillus sediminis]
MYESLEKFQLLEEEIAYLEFELNRIKRDLNQDSNCRSIQEKSKQITDDLISKKEQRDEAINLLNKFKGLENKILYGKYVEGKTLVRIAKELHYNVNWIYQKHVALIRMIKFAELMIKEGEQWRKALD